MVQIKNILYFIWDEIIKAIILTLFIRNPCKSNKCLVRACCTEVCADRRYYLNFCDHEGGIIFQRFCAGSVIFGIINLIWGLSKWAQLIF